MSPRGCCNAQCSLPAQEESPALGWTLLLTLQRLRVIAVPGASEVIQDRQRTERGDTETSS